jgi:hypothetical protein
LSVTAAIVPATCVPCPLSSWATADELRAFGPAFWKGQTYAVFLVMSEPATRMRLAPRSGWLKSEPVSTTATVAPAPRVTLQAWGAFTLTMPHWLPAQGSFAHAALAVRHAVSS